MNATGRDIVIWGGTGQMRVLAEFIVEQGYSIVAVIDQALSSAPLPGSCLFRDELEFDGWLAKRDLSKKLYGVVAIGGSKGEDRQVLAHAFERRGVTMVTLIHPTAFVASNAVVACGSQILARAIVGSGARIESSTIINTGGSVDHDCMIGRGSHVGPGAVLAGEVQVGENVFIGAGAVVLPRLVIGDGSIIGAGAIVTRSVERASVVFGNPARAAQHTPTPTSF